MPHAAYAERILRFVGARGYTPKQLHELAEAMGIAENEHGDFHAACKALMKTGRIVLGSRQAVTLPAPAGRIVGVFRGNSRGFGFVIPDTPNAHGDLFVPAQGTGGALTGDTVEARVARRGQRGGKMLYEGRIVAVLKRGRSRFVGELRREVGRWFVVPHGNVLHVPIVVGDPGARDAHSGDQVVVEIAQYPDEEHLEARGVIVKVLGPAGEPAVDARSIIEQYQLPGEFEATVLDDARRVAAAYDPKRAADDREDLRKLTIITIDPPDARDFDDAISISKTSSGLWELGVHIADVSHFVREGGPLDEEAKARATSVYLPRTVIPMLPEVLSNGVCSLQERQPRLTKSVFCTYDRRGSVKAARLANTIIQSTRRLTYQQVTEILSGKAGRTSAKIVALLKQAEQLAQTIRGRRIREGMLVLDLPEAEFVYDDHGAVTDVVPADRGFSHTLIEMFMVEANEAVARLLEGKGVPFLRRIHDQPRDLTLDDLRRFIGALGHRPAGSPALRNRPGRADLQALLEQVRGQPVAYAVNLAVLRSMQQAEYSPLPVGHYALASDSYCHFTSPIRRYPDLTVHRLVDAYVRGGFDSPKGRRGVATVEDLVQLGGQCSTNERRAEAAERELRLVLTLRLLETRLGDTFEGVVTGVANVGVFVQLDRLLVDGLLRFNGLPDDWWEVDTRLGSVVGERTGHRITIGDRLTVSLARIHIPTRQLDLALVRPLLKAKVEAITRASGHERGPKRPTGRSRSSAEAPRSGRARRPRRSGSAPSRPARRKAK